MNGDILSERSRCDKHCEELTDKHRQEITDLRDTSEREIEKLKEVVARTKDTQKQVNIYGNCFVCVCVHICSCLRVCMCVKVVLYFNHMPVLFQRLQVQVDYKYKQL